MSDKKDEGSKAEKKPEKTPEDKPEWPPKETYSIKNDDKYHKRKNDE